MPSDGCHSTSLFVCSENYTIFVFYKPLLSACPESSVYQLLHRCQKNDSIHFGHKILQMCLSLQLRLLLPELLPSKSDLGFNPMNVGGTPIELKKRCLQGSGC